jgi:acetamidase/formamidase
MPSLKTCRLDEFHMCVCVCVCVGVRFPGLIHPGLIGTAPSKELLDIWNAREKALVEEGEKSVTLGKHLHTRPLALLPGAKGALLGKVIFLNPNFCTFVLVALISTLW